MIPKRMSFFWSGGKISYLRYLTLLSFKTFHSDWESYLYRLDSNSVTESKWKSSLRQDFESYRGPDYLDYLGGLGIKVIEWKPDRRMPSRLSSPHACDLCQWQILSTVGGWYCDMDVLWIDSLDLQSVENSDAVFCLSDGWMTIGLMGSSKQNRLFSSVLNTAISNYNPVNYQCTGAEALYFLANLGSAWSRIHCAGEKTIKVLDARFNEINFSILDSVTVYPWNYKSLDKIFNENNQAPPGCKGIHWFGSNHLSQKWNNILTRDNLDSYSNTITRYMKCVESKQVSVLPPTEKQTI